MNLKKHIEKYGLIAVAVSFTVGQALHTFLLALVDNGIMPIFDVFLDEATWRTHFISIGSYHLMWGEIFSKGLQLVLTALVVFYLLELLEKHSAKASDA